MRLTSYVSIFAFALSMNACGRDPAWRNLLDDPGQSNQTTQTQTQTTETANANTNQPNGKGQTVANHTETTEIVRSLEVNGLDGTWWIYSVDGQSGILLAFARGMQFSLSSFRTYPGYVQSMATRGDYTIDGKRLHLDAAETTCPSLLPEFGSTASIDVLSNESIRVNQANRSIVLKRWERVEPGMTVVDWGCFSSDGDFFKHEWTPVQ